MFDFEKLEVYRTAHRLTIDVLKFLAARPALDIHLKDQLRRAMLSVTLNLAEGTGRVTGADKKRFYVIARSSVYECVAIIQVLKDMAILDEDLHQHWYSEFTAISKMLLALYRAA